jgi:hypothetical protein
LFGWAAKATCPVVGVDGMMAEKTAIVASAAIVASPHSLIASCPFVISVTTLADGLDKTPTGASHP